MIMGIDKPKGFRTRKAKIFMTNKNERKIVKEEIKK